MKIEQGFEIKKIFEQYIIVATGELSKTFHGIIKLNKTGFEIWNLIDNGLNKEQIIEHFVKKYSIDYNKATNDVNKIVQQMIEAKVVKLNDGD